MAWLDMLRQAAGETSKAEVARTLGVSRTAISLLLSGKYPGGTAKMAERVLEQYGAHSHVCPHLDRDVTPEECATNCNKSIPTASPAALRLWRACRECVHNVNKRG
ncbi:LacI family transcriptional regulator [Desulfovibrio sp. OttesenSCG-928-G15]|nr:LacI family transcriptional regulator [Desulfovibrio sp. OttesenSCG-928-G15]